MFNKKRLGLGMMIAGGIVAVAGAIVTMKNFKEDEVDYVEYEKDNCDYGLEKVENKNIPTNWEPAVTSEDIVATPFEPRHTEEEKNVETFVPTSTYNPNAEPVAMSQQDLESHGVTF